MQKQAKGLLVLQVTCFNLQKNLKLDETFYNILLSISIKSKRDTICEKCSVTINFNRFVCIVTILKLAACKITTCWSKVITKCPSYASIMWFLSYLFKSWCLDIEDNCNMSINYICKSLLLLIISLKMRNIL